MSTEVAITGIGAVTPLGVGADALMERWTAGVSGIEGGVGRCDEFDPRAFLSAKEARRTDRFTQLAVGACDEAVARAGWQDGPPYEPSRIGCVLATGIGGLTTLERQYEIFREQGPKRISPLAVPLMMGNAAAAVLAMRYDLRGYSSTPVTACAAGADAIATAAWLIRAGELDAAIAGGAESALTAFLQAGFAAMGATSTAGISRPFDARRDGFVLGEGAGVVVLEAEAGARARGATILARLCGIGTSSDAHHLTAPHPTGGGAACAMESALADAGADPSQIGHVNAHATSTPLNDRVETNALKHVLGATAGAIPVSATKSAVGHLLGAAGAVEMVATVRTLLDGVVPPTLNYGEPEEGLDLDYVTDGPRPLALTAQAPYALSNSFGFGGHNVVFVLAADAAA
jgi:3-oxoacyl-[acyl-carrier-protein] synthase II